MAANNTTTTATARLAKHVVAVIHHHLHVDGHVCAEGVADAAAVGPGTAAIVVEALAADGRLVLDEAATADDGPRWFTAPALAAQRINYGLSWREPGSRHIATANTFVVVPAGADDGLIVALIKADAKERHPGRSVRGWTFVGTPVDTAGGE